MCVLMLDYVNTLRPLADVPLNDKVRLGSNWEREKVLYLDFLESFKLTLKTINTVKKTR